MVETDTAAGAFLSRNPSALSHEYENGPREGAVRSVKVLFTTYSVRHSAPKRRSRQ